MQEEKYLKIYMLLKKKNSQHRMTKLAVVENIWPCKFHPKLLKREIPLQCTNCWGK